MLTNATSVFPPLPDDIAERVAAIRSNPSTQPRKGPPRPRTRAALGRDHISAREARVLDAICAGMNSAEAARALWISEETVKSHIKHMLARCGCANRTQLAYRWGRGELTERSRDGDIGRTP